VKILYCLLCLVLACFLVAPVVAVNWNPYLPLQVSSNTTLQSSGVFYFDSFTFGNTSILFHNINLGYFRSIPYLNFSTVDANVTVNRISNVDQTSLTLAGDGNLSVSIIGFGASPISVVTSENATVPFTYTSASDLLLLQPEVTTSETVLITFGADDDEVLGLAVAALLIGSTLGAVALVFAMRRRGSDGD
jgi:hypothetical protein